MTELLCQLLSDLNKTTYLTTTISSVLIICYCLTAIHNKKATFLVVAFLCLEVFGYSKLGDQLSYTNYYLSMASFYGAVYFIMNKNHYPLKTKFGCVIIILFYAVVPVDAYFYPKTQTVIYTYYLYIVMFVHLHLLTTFIRWRTLARSVGESIDSLVRILGYNYNIAFLVYNIRKE